MEENALLSCATQARPDTVEREYAELDEALGEAQQSLRVAIRHSNLYYCDYDIKTRTAYFGERMRKEYGLPATCQGVGPIETVLPLVYEKDRKSFERNFARLQNGKQTVAWESRCLDAVTGNYRWRRVAYSTLYNKKQEAIRYIGTALDINSAKQTESYFMQATAQNGIQTWVLDLREHTLAFVGDSRERTERGLPENIANVPESVISAGVFSPEEAQRIRKICTALYSGQRQASLRVPCRIGSNKSFTWYQIAAAAVDDGTGRFDRALVTVRDITTEMLVEERFRTEAEYRREFAASMISSCRVNLTAQEVEDIWIGERSVINEERRHEMDYAKRMLYVLAEVQLPETAAREMENDQLIAKFRAGERVWETTYVAVANAPRHTLWVQLQIRLLANPLTGDIIAFYYSKDVTATYMAELTAKAVAAQTSELGGYIDLDTRLAHSDAARVAPDKNKNGVDYDTLVRYIADHAVLPADRAQVLQAQCLDKVRQALESEPIYACHYHMVDDAGRVRNKVMRYLYDSTRRFILFYRTDNTDYMAQEERKRQQLQQALTEAQVANRAKTDFMSNMSHDIRTPLNSIVNLSRFIREELDDRDAVLADLEKIEDSSRFLQALISDILDMSRIERGKLVLNPEPYRYEEFVQYMCSTFAPLCADSGVALELTAPPLPPATVLVDKLRLNQVCANLLGNAIKYTPRGGYVRLCVEPGAPQNGALPMTIRVKDDGIGMSAEFQKKMFLPFEQEGRMQTEREGTGLGLSIVREIVEAMGGTIEVNSQLNAGTEVRLHFTFPQAPQTAAPLAPGGQPAAEEKRLAGRHVLLVEDHPTNRMIATRLLQKAGMQVECAANGALAVAAAQDHAEKLDVILMDLRMPVMDGLTAARQIRALESETRKMPPIIAMTANAYEEDRRNTCAAGMVDHLAKPIVPELLYATLARWIK